MDALLAKLTNLSYEFFGILVPGAAMMLGIVLVWISAGEIVAEIPFVGLTQLTFEDAIAFAEQLLNRSVIIAFVALVSVAYFLGHLLTWIARGGRRYDNVSSRNHMLDTLRFRPPKRKSPFSNQLEELYKSAIQRLLKEEAKKDDDQWTTFFPVAKMYLMQKASYSLVAIYQNKYTMHRAFAVVAALVVWSCLIIVVAGLLLFCGGYSTAPNWPGVVVLLIIALLAVWGFSSSYLYYWGLWGDYIVTETYALLRDEENHEPTPS
jgi:hypothetical protein